MISTTASVALRTSGKWTTATLVGSTGASLIVATSTVSDSLLETEADIGAQTFRDDTQRTLSANEQLRSVETS